MRRFQEYLEIRTASPSSFSDDGGRLLISSNLTGTSQLYRADLRSPSAELVQLTDEAEPVGGVYLPNRGELLVTMDEGGNERAQLYLLDDEPGAQLRPLVYEPEFLHIIGGVSRDGRLISYASNRRNGKDFDVYVLDVDAGFPDGDRLVLSIGGWCQPTGFSPDGGWLAVVRLTERNGDNDLYLVDLHAADGSADAIVHVSPHDDEASFGRPTWYPDSSSFLFATDTGRDVRAVARYDVGRGSWEYVIERDWDCAAQIPWSGDRLILTSNEEGYTRAELLDPVTFDAVGEVPLPGRGQAAFVFSRDGRSLAFAFLSAVEAGDAWVHDLEGGETARVTTSPRAVPVAEMVEPSLHRFASFDGEQVPVFLFEPKTPPPAEGRPVVVNIHGGPESQYVPSFSAVHQYLVSRGYAVVAPNVRGSTGYGKRFQHLDDVEKRLDSVRDLASLHEWLGARDGLDAERAALMGGSYGGYMVLAGLVFQPELWAAGVDIVGISSLVTFLENTSVWRRAFREREYGSLEHDREFLEHASPITHIERLRAPLLIMHGANDPRVPVTEAEQIHKALEAKGVRCELLVYGDEGHGLAKLANRLDAYPKVADFLDDVLGVAPA